MRRGIEGLAFAAAALAGQAVLADRPDISVPAGPLARAMVALSTQTHATIGLTDQSLGTLRTHPVAGRLDTAAALARMLSGTGARAVRIADAVWRIERALPAAVSSPRRHAAADGDTPAGGDIVVTASKRDLPLASYAGSVAIVTRDDLPPSIAAMGSEALVARLPILSSTELGPGRNKLFIRGIADSSFNGPSQSTVGQYLGDVRLTYNAPDPDLNLYDIRAVEVLEGPQGTLYGAGSLGGIIRIIPEEPVLGTWGGGVDVGGSLRAHGAAGWDMAGVINAPLGASAGALRVVAFRSLEGGYVDDAGRGLRNVNATRAKGGRATLRLEPGGGWTIDVGGAIQNYFTDDGQYSERGLPPLTRSTSLAQPYDDDYGLGSVVITLDTGGLRFVSANAIVRQNASSTYDFTEPGGPVTLFRQTNRISLIASENRLSRRAVDGTGWVIGVSLLHDAERLDRVLGPPSAPQTILGVNNRVTSMAAYGEAGVRVLPGLIITGGARLEYQSQSGEPRGPDDERLESRRRKVELLPSAALLWRPVSPLRVFARYQQGYRPGGLSVAQNGAVQRFRGDSVATAELGAALAEKGPLGGSLTLSRVHWEHIQADLVDMSGLPFTANIGTGRVWGVEAGAHWRPWVGLRVETKLLFNDGRLTAATSGVGQPGDPLPNVARWGASGSIAQRVALGGAALRTRALIRYVGPSLLAVGNALDLKQGNYAEVAAGADVEFRRWRVSLDVSNVLDALGNRFALGDPRTVSLGRQIVPIAPRTIRVGTAFTF